MKHTIIVCGYGPGISDAVARRFGKAGHPVAIVARNTQRLADGAAALKAEGIKVEPFVADLGDVEAIQRTVREVRAAMGPIGIVHWNAYSNIGGDLLSASPDDLSQSLTVRVVGYIAAIQASLADLQANQGAVLSTSGAMVFSSPETDALAKDFAVLAISVTAQHKATGILTQALASRGIYVGEVVVNGFVKGSEFTSEHKTLLEPADIAEQFWDLNATRKTHSVVFGQALAIRSSDHHA